MTRLTLLRTFYQPRTGGPRFVFFLGNSEIYTGEIATETGINVADISVERTRIPHRVSDLLAAGVLIRFAVTTGTPTNPKTVKLLCRNGMFDGIRTIDGLLGKSLPSGVIRSVRVPRKASFA